MTSIRKIIVFNVLCLIVFSRIAISQDYPREMQKMFRSTLKDYSKYQFFAVPMSGFGVGTMYPKSAKQDKLDIKTEGLYGDPKTWWINSNDDANNKKEADLIFSGADSAAINLKGKTTKSLSLGATLPALFKLVTGSGSVDWNRNVAVTLTADSATNHLINWSELNDAVNGAPNQKPPMLPMIKESVAHHIHSHDFVITVGDVVITKLSAHIAVTKALDAKAQAQLNEAASAFAKGSKVNFEYKSNDDGSFDLTATKPVVVAVFVGQPPPGSLRAAAKRGIPGLATPSLLQQLESAEADGNDIPVN